MISMPVVRYVLTAARRDKLLWTLTVMIACGASLGVFLGSSAMTEAGSFSTVLGSGGLRVLGVLGIVLFTCFHMRRSFESREVEFLLSRPLSRMTFLFSHALAFILLALGIAFVVVCAVFLSGKPSLQGLAVWGGSLAAEYAVMAIGALFFSMVLSSASGAALAAFGLYVLARLIGTLIGITLKTPENIWFAILDKVMQVISIFVPRFDLMGQTSWLVYGVDGSSTLALKEHATGYAGFLLEHLGAAGFIALQGVLFSSLLLAAAAFDFVRRRF